MTNTSINGKVSWRSASAVIGTILAMVAILTYAHLALASNARVDGIDKRLERIENKLDRLLERP